MPPLPAPVRQRPVRAPYRSKKGSEADRQYTQHVAQNDTESRLDMRMAEFAKRRKNGDPNVAHDEVEFVLESIPYILKHYECNDRDSRREVYQQYLTHVEDVQDRTAKGTPELCTVCCEGFVEKMRNAYVCSHCGETDKGYCEFNKSTFKNPPSRGQRQQVYKPLNHFNETLAHFQGKETTEIPREITDFVREAAALHYPLERPTHAHVKKLLRSRKLNKYYRNIPSIMQSAFGVQCPEFTAQQLDALRDMFMQTQAVFKESCDDRINFLSVNYLLFKFCELLGWLSYLPHIPLLKSADKLSDHDRTWAAICGKLGWNFIKTRTTPRCLMTV